MEIFLYYIVLFSAMYAVCELLIKSKKVNQFLNYILDMEE